MDKTSIFKASQLADELRAALLKDGFDSSQSDRILGIVFPIFISQLGTSLYLPTPEMLEQYDNISPGLGLRVLQIATEELQSRQRLAEYLPKLYEYKPKISFISLITANYISTLIFLIGLLAMTLVISTSIPDFVGALRRLFEEHKNFGSLFVVTSAFADQPNGTQSTYSSPIGPLFVYGVYILLAIAYLVSLYQIFFGKDEKDKINALDVFKNLNAFFIGAITGKFV